MYENLFWKLGENFGISFFHLSNFDKILGSKLEYYVHGTHCPNSWIGLCKASFGPPILVGRARNGSTLSIWVIYNHHVLVQEIYKSIIVIDLQNSQWRMTIIQFRRTIAHDMYSRSVVCNLFVILIYQKGVSRHTKLWISQSFQGFEFVGNRSRVSTVNIRHATSIHIVDH